MGKTVEQALLEVMEEEELASLRQQQVCECVCVVTFVCSFVCVCPYYVHVGMCMCEPCVSTYTFLCVHVLVCACHCGCMLSCWCNSKLCCVLPACV